MLSHYLLVWSVLLVALLLACVALIIALDLAYGEAPPPVRAVTPADLADPLAVTLDPSRCILNRKTSAIRGTENRQGARVGLCAQDEGLPAAYRPAQVTR